MRHDSRLVNTFEIRANLSSPQGVRSVGRQLFENRKLQVSSPIPRCVLSRPFSFGMAYVPKVLTLALAEELGSFRKNTFSSPDASKLSEFRSAKCAFSSPFGLITRPKPNIFRSLTLFHKHQRLIIARRIIVIDRHGHRLFVRAYLELPP